MESKMFSTLVFFLIFLVACNNKTVENPTNARDIGNPIAEDILADNLEADIFLLNGIIYSNAEDIDWVNEKEWIVGEEVAEITKQTTERVEFQSGTATQLQVGTKIYETVEPSSVYIAIVNKKEIRYIGLREG